MNKKPARDGLKPLTHDEVIETTEKVKESFPTFVKRLVQVI